MHHRLDHQRRFQHGRHTKQIIGAVPIVLGNPDPCLVLVPHLARLDHIEQQRFTDGACGHALARMVRYHYRLPDTLAEHRSTSYHAPCDISYRAISLASGFTHFSQFAHRNVHDHDVGLEFLRQLHGLAAIGRLTHHSDTRQSTRAPEDLTTFA